LKTYNILFLCTHNSARSIIGEIIANTHISKKFIGYSAGSHPIESVHPLALEIADEYGYPRDQLRSKLWNEYASFESPKMDFIIVVCEGPVVSGQPYWPGNPINASWGFEDIALIQGSEELKRRAFKKVKVELQRRLDILSSLPESSLTEETLQLIHQKK